MKAWKRLTIRLIATIAGSIASALLIVPASAVTLHPDADTFTNGSQVNQNNGTSSNVFVRNVGTGGERGASSVPAVRSNTTCRPDSE